MLNEKYQITTKGKNAKVTIVIFTFLVILIPTVFWILDFSFKPENLKFFFGILIVGFEIVTFYSLLRYFLKTQKALENKDLIDKNLFQTQKIEALGTLAGGIVHDFNNVLMGMQGYFSLLDIDLQDLIKQNPEYK